MRSWLLPTALVAAALVPALAAAHASKSPERAILQFRPDATRLLYELVIPAGAEAVQWRVRFDLNHDGRLASAEYQALARGLGEAVRERISLKLEEIRLPLTLVDAKVTPGAAPDGLSGKLAAMVMLTTRALPPGPRRLELETVPVVDPRRPVLFRIEAVGAKVVSAVGGLDAGLADGTVSVLLAKGARCTLRVDVPTATAK